jgi:hypothetical protein
MASKRTLKGLRILIPDFLNPNEFYYREYPEDGYTALANFRAFREGQGWIVEFDQVDPARGACKSTGKFVKDYEAVE